MTQKEIAKMLNITQAAVSMALKGSDQISPALRKSVCRLAENTGYRPNLAGQMLRQKRSNLIGAIFPRFTNPFYAELFENIQCRLLPHGYMLYLASAETSAEQEKVIENLWRMCAAGVIAISNGKLPALLKLKQTGMAVVLYGEKYKPEVAVSQVISDRYEPARQLMCTLLERGRRRILFLGRSAPCAAREQAYYDVMTEAGLEPVFVPLRKSHHQRLMGAAYDTMRKTLAEYPETDAVFAVSDEVAIAAHRAITGSGRSIPGDIALVGFDNIPTGAYLSPSLTTVEQPIGEIAAALIREFFAALREPDRAAHVAISGKVIIRESV